MEDSKYNGWTNYETWNVNLWIDNDGSDEMWREQAQEALQRAIEDDEREPKDEAERVLAEAMQAYFDENMPEVSGTYADLLGAALSAVNWREIAEHYVSELELFAAGWNMPGYMPDNPPSLFADFESARDYIVETIEQHADDEDEEFNASEFSGAARWAGEQKGPEFSTRAGQYVYWVAKV